MISGMLLNPVKSLSYLVGYCHNWLKIVLFDKTGRLHDSLYKFAACCNLLECKAFETHLVFA